MPTVRRSRSLPVAAASTWRLIADPHNLPRWWPETVRVESVEGAPGALRSRFTQVFESTRGKAVRADYRITGSTKGERLVWEQRIEGTPFEKFLRAAALELRVDAEDEERSRVTLEARRTMRGTSKLGSPMMKGATKRSLDAALDGIEQALTGSEPA